MRERISTAPDGMCYPIPNEAELAASYSSLRRAANSHRGRGRQIVAVQGLGFVGTAVAAAIADARDSSGDPLYFAIGVELLSSAGYWKVAKLNHGVAPLVSSDIELFPIINRAVHKTKNLSTTFSELVYSKADVIVVDVALDVEDTVVRGTYDIVVDLQGFKEAMAAIGRHMRQEA